MNYIYYLRCIPADFEILKTLGQTLGAIIVHPAQTLEVEIPLDNGDFETITETIEERIEVPGGGHWDYIGPISQPAGEFVYDPEFGAQEVLATLKDPQGNEYIHVNLLTPVNLREAALALAQANPAIAAGLANLSRFFLVDANGDAKPPAAPHRVFAT